MDSVIYMDLRDLNEKNKIGPMQDSKDNRMFYGFNDLFAVGDWKDQGIL
ncbi:MAG: hypothetical protein HY789_14030 [Deltaproteobacteria bacterium]|nr:hypothetical protein [Deltaproteobacteria bacterium]